MRGEKTKFKCSKVAQDRAAPVADTREQVVCPPGGICNAVFQGLINDDINKESLQTGPHTCSASRRKSPISNRR
jgi:hypothetical protein